MPLQSIADLRRNEIAKAALSIFASEGAPGLTIERVSKEIGASKGIVLHHFGSKDALVNRVVGDVLRILGGELRAAVPRQGEPSDRMRSLLGFCVNDELFTETYAKAFLTAQASALTDPAYRRLRHVAQRRLTSNLVYFLRPLAGAIEARPISDSLCALLDGLWLKRALEPTEITPGAAKALLLTHLEESLSFQPKP